MACGTLGDHVCQGGDLQDMEGASITVGDGVIIATNDGIQKAKVLDIRSKVILVETKDGLIRVAIPEKVLKYE